MREELNTRWMQPTVGSFAEDVWFVVQCWGFEQNVHRNVDFFRDTGSLVPLLR